MSKEKRILADNNLFGRLRVNTPFQVALSQEANSCKHLPELTYPMDQFWMIMFFI